MAMITRDTVRLEAEEERELVEAAQSGDARALGVLLDAHYRRMFHVALKITRDASKAEDVTQAACLLVWQRIDQFRAEARFGSWLTRIVVNTALLKHRREKRMVPMPEIFPAEAVCGAPAVERQTAHRELLGMTDAALASSRDGDRELFVRRFVDGLSLNALSAETGLSLPALKSRFHRARLRLKAQAKAEGWSAMAA